MVTRVRTLPKRPLPPTFLARLAELETLYLLKGDPILRSGFGGGPERWRKEREPLLDAITQDGSFLDVGCAVGYLAECVASWGRERGLQITPHGLDLGKYLINDAQARLPAWRDNFHVGNAWEWQPPRRYSYVYTLSDIVPAYFRGACYKRLLRDFVAPGGRLIIGSYGSRSRSEKPWDMRRWLNTIGLKVAGHSSGGEPRITNVVWINA